MKSVLLLTAAFTGATLLSAPSQAQPIKTNNTYVPYSGAAKGSQPEVNKSAKSIEGSSGSSPVDTGGQSGGNKPAAGKSLTTVTFPSPTASGQAKVVPAKSGSSKSTGGSGRGR